MRNLEIGYVKKFEIGNFSKLRVGKSWLKDVAKWLSRMTKWVEPKEIIGFS